MENVCVCVRVLSWFRPKFRPEWRWRRKTSIEEVLVVDHEGEDGGRVEAEVEDEMGQEISTREKLGEE